MDKTNNSESSILVAHIADTHLRDTQYAAASRGVDFFNAAKSAVSVACREADITVLCGDNFDRARPSAKVIGQLMQLDQMFRAAGKYCVAITGNHDWSTPTWLSTLFPREDAVGDIDLNSGPGGIVHLDGLSAGFKGFTIAGIPPFTCAKFRNNLAEVSLMAREADVVLYHGFVDGVATILHKLKEPLHVDELPVSMNNKAWLLGDIHIQGYVRKPRPGGGETLIGYPGSTEMCSSSESTEKSIPLLRVTKTAAEVVKKLPVDTRPYIAMSVTNEEELDELISKVTAVADKHPVVNCKFDREMTSVISRLHSVLDAQRAVIRCYPLPVVREDQKRHEDEDDDKDQEDLGIEFFVTERFKEREDLSTLALALLHRGDSDAEGILSKFIETRRQETAVREED